MNKLKFPLYFLFLPFLLWGCKGGNKTPGTMPDTRPEANILHYWDSFNFSDSVALNNPDIGEQALVDFLAALPKVPKEAGIKAVKVMLSKAKPYPAALNYFTKTYEHYLYDPNSPMRDDSFYEPVVTFLLDSCQLSTSDQNRYSTLLRLLRKNKVGSQATEFEFEQVDGKKSELYELGSPFTLLFFYEPGCQHCEAAIAELKNSPRIQQLLESKKLQIAAIYALGGREIWKAYQTYIPAAWINGFDAGNRIRREKLYDLKASPTIYLLDENHTVLLKDASIPEVVLLMN